jgi:hypothetical protein
MTRDYAGPERRRFPRFALEVPVQVLYPGYWNEDSPNPVLGVTHNLSEGGVCFRVTSRIPVRELILHFDYEGMGAEYVQAEIVKEQAGPGDDWQYHCQLKRTLGTVAPLLAFDSLSL